MSTLKSPRPTPKFFSESETFSTKKARNTPKEQGPPRPPSKSIPQCSRLFNKTVVRNNGRASAISFKDNDISLYNDLYKEDTKELYFEMCFEVKSKIGAGSFGEVFKVKSKHDGRYYAIKRSRERFRGESDRQRKLEEVKKHEELPAHINLIQFIKAWEERQHLYIQSELCSKSLSIFAEQNHDIPESWIWKYLVDLLMAVKHLHDYDLLHLDIKPDNIFITNNGICKLGDFGLILDLREGDLSAAQEGDPKYLAPEVLNGNFTKAADIFSLGITILELASDLDLPPGGDTWHQLRHNHIPPHICHKLSLPLKRVIQHMMNNDFRKRPTAADMLEIPDVKKVLRKRRIELRIKKGTSAVKLFFLGIISWVFLNCQFLIYPLFWLLSKLKIPTKRNHKPKNHGTSTPSFSNSNSNPDRPHFDPSFSDDEVFEDLNNTSLDPIPFSESSNSSGSKNGSFYIPSLPSRPHLNSTPALLKHRANSKSPFVPQGLDSYRISPNASLVNPAMQSPTLLNHSNNVTTPCDLSQENSSKFKSVDVSRTSIGPRNLMKVFEAADWDEAL